KLNESSGKSIIVANITSGAANKAIYGWSAYGSAKASINAYTTTVGKEQSELNTNNKIFAFRPGVMDTDMTKDIREKDKKKNNEKYAFRPGVMKTEMKKHIKEKDKEAFIEVENFKNYKKSNLLKDTDVVGGVLVDILTNESDIKNGQIYNITDYI